MADKEANHLTDAEVFEMTKELRAKYLPGDPLNTPPPIPADPDDMTPQDYINESNWKGARRGR